MALTISALRIAKGAGGSEREVVFDDGNDGGCSAGGIREGIEVGDNAVAVFIAIVQETFCELLILVARAHREAEGISLREEVGKSSGSDGIEVGLGGSRGAIGGVQRGEHLRLAFVQSLVHLTGLFDEDHDFVGVWIGDITDTLNLAVPETLSLKTFAQLVDVRWLGKAHVHVGAPAEIDAVLDATLKEDSGPSNDQKRPA